MHPISCETPQNMVLSPYKRYALMVKRSRRRPLTAESRVRFPMGVPKKALALASTFFYPHREYAMKPLFHCSTLRVANP